LSGALPRLFVGDVQGCADELDELLARARDRFGDAFAVWQVGDLVNRGPGSLRVLRRMRELVEAERGCAVLGNHEVALLRVFFGQRRLRPEDTYGDVLGAPDVEEWVDWLRTRPLVATGSLGVTRFAMVHAAVHPDWSLEELRARAAAVEARLGASDRAGAERMLAADRGADPDADTLWRLLTCRSAAADGSWSSAEPARPEDAWHARWSARGHDYGVVYGHWSMQRLHVAPGLRGLDTGCVHHGRGSDGWLTAWLPDLPRPGVDGCENGRASAFALPDDRFWQVRARRQYYGLDAAAEGKSPD